MNSTWQLSIQQAVSLVVAKLSTGSRFCIHSIRQFVDSVFLSAFNSESRLQELESRVAALSDRVAGLRQRVLIARVGSLSIYGSGTVRRINR